MTMQKKSEPEKKEVKRVGSLTDLRAKDIDITVDYGDYSEVWPCRMLSYARWVEIGHMVPIAQPPINGVDKRGYPIVDTKDPAYQRQLDMDANRRAAMRLAEFIQVEIEGDTLEEKAVAVIDTLPPGTFMALTRQMNTLYNEGEASVVARAATFQPSGKSDPQDS